MFALIVVSLLALLVSNVRSFQFNHNNNNNNNNAFLKRAIKNAATAAVTASLLTGLSPFPSLAETVQIPELSAAEVIQADIGPKVLLLKDILFVLKLFPTFSDQQDYAQLRSSLRSSPLIDLRKTCKKLKPLLSPAARQDAFQAKFDAMLESLEALDVKALRRTQGENVPKKGEKDAELLAAIELLIKNFEGMLATTNNSN